MSAPTNSPTKGQESATVNANEGAALLGIGRTRFWQLRQHYRLKRVEWSSAGRPRYRREDVLALQGRADGMVEGSPEWVAEMHRRAREAADAAGD